MIDRGIWSSGWVRYGMRVLALGLVALLAWRLHELLRTSSGDLANANLRIFAIAALASLLAVVSYGAVWPIVLRRIGAPVPHDAVRLFLQSQLGKYVPGSVWQYAGRVGFAKTRGVPARLTMISVGIELAASVAAAALVAVFVLPLELALIVLAILAAVVTATWVLRLRPSERLLSAFTGTVRRVVPLAPADLAAALRATPAVIVLYVPVWAVYGVALWLTARSLTPIPATDVVYVSATFALGWLVGMAAIFAPSGIGVREAVLVGLLGPRIGHADAIVVAAMSRVLLTCADLLGAGSAAFLSRVSREHAAAGGATMSSRGHGALELSHSSDRTRSAAMDDADHPLRVVYYGTYEPDYPRNAQVISCLRSAGVVVMESGVSPWNDRRHKFGLGLSGAVRLATAEARLLMVRPKDFDLMIVGYPGHFDMPLARRVAGARPIVFNPLLSLYDSLVLDRARWKERSAYARVLQAVDRRAIRLADLTIAGTEAEADFFATLADVPREKVDVCLVGAEERVFRPGWRPGNAFSCLFFGKLIPLHGPETILEAARLAPEIRFRIIGSGQLDGLLERDRPSNVEWVRWVDYERLPEELYDAGCSLGVFGTTEKALRVIPNKAYAALACGTPLITSDTPGSRELLTDGESALLVPPGDPGALATAIRRVAADTALAERLSDGGLDAYRRKASEAVLGSRWRGLLEEQLRRAVERATAKSLGVERNATSAENW